MKTANMLNQHIYTSRIIPRERSGNKHKAADENPVYVCTAIPWVFEFTNDRLLGFLNPTYTVCTLENHVDILSALHTLKAEGWDASAKKRWKARNQ